MPDMTDSGCAYLFGPYVLDADTGTLGCDGAAVTLGARATALLLALVRAAGEIVPAAELMKAAWPSTHVDDANLRVNIATLRRALGDGRGGARYIVNESGRGYCFVAEVRRAVAARSAPPRLPGPFAPRLPVQRLIGRSAEVEAVLDRLRANRLVTITGPGGIGKTAVAVAAAREMAGQLESGACFVDLSALVEPSLIPGAIAAALRIPALREPALRRLAEELRNACLLLVLDNCEHLVQAVAELAEELMRQCEGIRLLTTSREVLRAEGEVSFRLGALACPPEGAAPDTATALAYAAVELFHERAGSAHDGYRLTDAAALKVSELCRRLDGSPLAIELAAACVPAFGIEGLVSLLDDRLSILRQGRRTLVRHRTLRDVMDWSYGLLGTGEQRILACLGVFRGTFSLHGAIMVAGGDPSSQRVAETLADLVAKSLVAADTGGHRTEYRLLETTRAYAQDKLREQGGEQDAMSRHAGFVGSLLETAAAEWTRIPRALWIEEYGRTIDDIRAALDWAFSEDGDLLSGLSLMIASAPVWHGLSRLAEFSRRVEGALRAIPSDRAVEEEGRRAVLQGEMQLQLLLASQVYNTAGPTDVGIAALSRALMLSETLGERSRHILALWGLAGLRMERGDPQATLAHVKRIRELAAGEDEAEAVGNRMMALAHFYSGHLRGARSFADRAVKICPSTTATFATFRWDQATTARANLAKILWLQGEADAGMSLMKEVVNDGQAARMPASFCYILGFRAIPLALWAGDAVLARDWCALLHRTARDCSFHYFELWARCFEGAADILAGHETPAARDLRARVPGLTCLHREILITVAPCLVDDEAVDRVESGSPSWCAAEILRAEGERRLVRDGLSAAGEASALFSRALRIAREQGAEAWVRRAMGSASALERRCERAAGRRQHPDGAALPSLHFPFGRAQSVKAGLMVQEAGEGGS